jgi:hypothetical protein
MTMMTSWGDSYPKIPGTFLQVRPLTEATDAATTLTAAQTIGGMVTMTPTAARTITLPTATAILALLQPGVQIGTSFEISIRNGAATTHAITLAGPSGGGITIDGVATVAHASSATFLARVTGETTPAITFHRI